MQRELSTLSERDWDLLVIGGGIAGACVAWDAALRGLSVALVERGDFAQGASAHCFKMIHGGIRYLQHADLIRVRESNRERRALLRIAPHLCAPLPILIPTYGAGMQGKSLLRAGAAVYDALTFDRNRGIDDPARQLPASHAVSREEALAILPSLDDRGLSGGVVFHDAQMYSPARLVLAFLLSAAERGASVANHTEALRLVVSEGRIRGAVVRDTLSDDEFEIRARNVVNATGGWAQGLLDQSLGRGLPARPSFSRDACFVLDRPLVEDTAVALVGSTRDPDALVSRSARHLFAVPWRGKTLCGVWHRVHERSPDRCEIAEEELQSWMKEFQGACPALELRREDVALTQAGLTLFGENTQGAQHLSYGHRSLVVDHGQSGGPAGLITLVTVRYTVARREAERVVDRLVARLGVTSARCRTEATPLYGGDVENFDALLREAGQRFPELPAESLHPLVRNHGSRYGDLLMGPQAGASAGARLGRTQTLGAEITHAVDREMAHTLSDVVFRRTDLGTAGWPGTRALEDAADLMASRLGWSPERRDREIDETRSLFPNHPGLLGEQP